VITHIEPVEFNQSPYFILITPNHNLYNRKILTFVQINNLLTQPHFIDHYLNCSILPPKIQLPIHSLTTQNVFHKSKLRPHPKRPKILPRLHPPKNPTRPQSPQIRRRHSGQIKYWSTSWVITQKLVRSK